MYEPLILSKYFTSQLADSSASIESPYAKEIHSHAGDILLAMILGIAIIFAIWKMSCQYRRYILAQQRKLLERIWQLNVYK